MQPLNVNYTYFITGAAGFIGYHLAKRLLEAGATVVGYDNMNDYYDVNLKEYRIKAIIDSEKFTLIRGDIADKATLEDAFKQYKPDVVINLAAQAGVRYSIENPDSYVQSNLVGFANILECCRHYEVEHLVYASSSSVYGGNEKVPFSTADQVDRPVSLYAATKKANELMAYSYSKLYGMKTTGLRFFTVYGPMGRPDMAAYKFALKIMENQPIQIYNFGNMERDFTYIDDIITGVCDVLCNPPKADNLGAQYKIYNIGNNKPEKLMDFVTVLEKKLGKEAEKEYLPMQPGDVPATYADVSELEKDFGFKPSTSIEYGIEQFVNWFMEYHNYR